MGIIQYWTNLLTVKAKDVYTCSMVEKNFQTLWGNYLQKNPPIETEVHELKLCKANSFPFDAVKPHQIIGLLSANDGLYHRIYDQPWIAGTGFQPLKPFDCMYIKGGKGYVVICFYVPRKYKKVFKIPIGEFIKIKSMHPRKSIRLAELELLIKPIEI
jgi:hypothetical protein